MMMIYLKHESHADPLVLNNVSTDIDFDTFKARCLDKMGIDGDVDIIKDKECRPKVTDVADLEHENTVILRPKRKRDDPVDDNKRARTEAVMDIVPVETPKEVPNGPALRATCPLGYEWVERVAGRKNAFDRWFVGNDNIVTAVIVHKVKDHAPIELYLTLDEITKYGEKYNNVPGLTRLCAKRVQTHRKSRA